MLDPSGIIENPLIPSGIIETPLVPSGSFGDWLVSPVLLANLANLGSKVQLCAARMGFLLLAALLCLLLQPAAVHACQARARSSSLERVGQRAGAQKAGVAVNVRSAQHAAQNVSSTARLNRGKQPAVERRHFRGPGPPI